MAKGSRQLIRLCSTSSGHSAAQPLRQQGPQLLCCLLTSLRELTTQVGSKRPRLLALYPSDPSSAELSPDLHDISKHAVAMGIRYAGAWGSLRMPDLATMVEVIEHMDPPILA